MDRECGNKTQRLHIFGFNYTLSKFIVDNGLEGLQRKENPDSSEFTHYDRCCGPRSMIRSFSTNIKFASNAKINHIMVLFTGHCNDIFLLDRFSSKNKVGNDKLYFNNFLLCKHEFSSITKNLCFIKNTKKPISLQVTGPNTPIFVLKEMLGHFLKIPALQIY